MKLEGGERLVLKTLLELQGDSGENVEDFRVAAVTKMGVQDVRDWLFGWSCIDQCRLPLGCTFPENTEPAATGQGVVSADFSTPTGERPSRARRGSPR